MYLDDLPMWALVGDFGQGHTDHEKEGDDMFLWTHKRIDIGVNGNQIVDVNLTTSKREKIEIGKTIDFSYQARAPLVFVFLRVPGQTADTRRCR